MADELHRLGMIDVDVGMATFPPPEPTESDRRRILAGPY